MKIVFLLFVMTACFLDAPSINAASDPGGFLGLKWSQSPAECKKLGFCSNDKIKPKDKLVSEIVFKGKTTDIDGVELRFSSFAFNNSKYYMGIAAFDSSSTSFDTLKNALIAKYGKPTAATPVPFRAGRSGKHESSSPTTKAPARSCTLTYRCSPRWRRPRSIHRTNSPRKNKNRSIRQVSQICRFSDLSDLYVRGFHIRSVNL